MDKKKLKIDISGVKNKDKVYKIVSKLKGDFYGKKEETYKT